MFRAFDRIDAARFGINYRAVIWRSIRWNRRRVRVERVGRNNLQVVIKAGVWFGAALSNTERSIVWSAVRSVGFRILTGLSWPNQETLLSGLADDKRLELKS